MSWWIDVLEGVAATAPEIGSGVYNVLSHTKAEALLVDEQVLAKLTELAGTEISPIVNNLGETIGYAARSAAASNGSTALSNTWISIARDASVVTEEIQQAALPLLEGGTTADLAVGDSLATFAADATTGVGGAAGTGVGSTALATVAGPAIAVALGVGAGVALYNIAPEFWTSVSEKLQTAGKMIGDKVISWFKTDGTEYYDDETIAIIKDALLKDGYLSSSQEATIEDTSSLFNPTSWEMPAKYVLSDTMVWPGFQNDGRYYKYKTSIPVWFSWGSLNNVPSPHVMMVSEQPFTEESQGFLSNGSVWSYPNHVRRSSSPLTRNGITFHVLYDTPYTGEASYQQILQWGLEGLCVPDLSVINKNLPVNTNRPTWDLGYIIKYGDGGFTPSPQDLPEEDNGDSRLVSPVPTSVTDPLRTPSTSPDYNPTDYYDPTPSPSDKPDPSDVPTPQVDPTPQPDPQPSPDPHPTPDPTNPSDPGDTNPDTPGNEDTGDSPMPPAIIPMAASAVSKIFNPTQGEVDALGQYLWSSTNIEDILKLFQSPLDGIIALFKLYATPATGGHEGIKLGYLPTGVSAAVVTRQVVTVDCGEIDVPLVKQNATDYPPYTTIQIYLPFIGIEPLNAYDLVGSQLACQYRVDCYTGACIAQLIVKRDNMTAKLYEFSGNCAQQIPLTSGNFLQLAGNIISGAISGAVHGGAVGAAVGAGSSLIHSNVEVGRSGNLSANAGMLGSRIPYIIITRAISADATNYSYFYGHPANKNVYLRNCRGYVRVKDIILHTSATEAEKAEIERLLKEGVYI